MRVGDRWVLVVSVQAGGSAGCVAALTGSYDGSRLVDGKWGRLAFGTAPYATSLFQDRRGHPCMISWLREDPRWKTDAAGWAGAHSLVSSLTIDRAGRVTASPHPAVLHGTVFTRLTCTSSVCAIRVTPGVPEHATVRGDGPVEIEVRQQRRRLARITRSRGQHTLAIDRPGARLDVIPCDVCDPIEVFVDADILEVFVGGNYGAWRLRPEM